MLVGQCDMNLGITEIVCDDIYTDFSAQPNQVQDWIDRSFLIDDNKRQYDKNVIKKLKQIEL